MVAVVVVTVKRVVEAVVDVREVTVEVEVEAVAVTLLVEVETEMQEQALEMRESG
jgi:hypothetical protein